MHLMNKDGSDNYNVKPEYFAANFLYHSLIFFQDNSVIYFI